MGAWRSKLIFLLIVYFAGFATAIYCLAPVPETRTSQLGEKSFANSALIASLLFFLQLYS